MAQRYPRTRYPECDRCPWAKEWTFGGENEPANPCEDCKVSKYRWSNFQPNFSGKVMDRRFMKKWRPSGPKPWSDEELERFYETGDWDEPKRMKAKRRKTTMLDRAMRMVKG